jgi:hypothetical protein
VNPINQPMVDCCLRMAAARGETPYGIAYRVAAETLAAASVSVFHCTREQLSALTSTFDISPRITVEGFATDYRFEYPKGMCKNNPNQALYDTLITQAKWCYRRPPRYHEQCEKFNEMAARIMLLENPLTTLPNKEEFISAEGQVVKNFIEEFLSGHRTRPSMRNSELSRYQFPPLQNVENEDLYNHLYCYAWNNSRYWCTMEAVGACPERIHLTKNRRIVPELPDLNPMYRQQIVDALLIL